MTAIIAKQGYKVLSAIDGGAAIQLVKETTDAIDLVVTDVVMPVLSGPDMMKELYAARPDLRCLYVSGYTDEAIVHHGVLDEGVHLMQKPFSREALLRKIRQLLDSPNP